MGVRREVLPIFVLLIAAIANAQSQPPQNSGQANSAPPLTAAQKQQLETFSLYSEFFDRVKGVEALADRSEAMYPTLPHRARRLIQDNVQLSDPAWKQVKIVATDYNTKLDAIRAGHKAALDDYKAQHPNQKYSPEFLHQHGPGISGQQKLQLEVDHVNQLKATLSPADFQQLDNWVRTSMRNGGVR